MIKIPGISLPTFEGQAGDSQKLVKGTAEGKAPNAEISAIGQIPDRNSRQERKIIAVLSGGDYSVLGKQDVAMTYDDRVAVLRQIAIGEIDINDFRKLLLEIKAPADYEDNPNSPVGLFRESRKGT